MDPKGIRKGSERHTTELPSSWAGLSVAVRRRQILWHRRKLPIGARQRGQVTSRIIQTSAQEAWKVCWQGNLSLGAAYRQFLVGF